MPVDPILAKLLASLFIALSNGLTAPAPPSLADQAPGPVVWSAYWQPDVAVSTETDLVVQLADGTTYYSAASSAVSPAKNP
jgi:hypothetical protein